MKILNALYLILNTELSKFKKGSYTFSEIYHSHARILIPFWSISFIESISGVVLPLLCGILLYYIGLKTTVMLNPPTFRITVDALFCTSGRAVEYFQYCTE
jgi:dolichyl-phosphate-mannose--protein O-mannosyl transferase